MIVTSAADQGLVDIHDRRPLVLVPEAAREWMRQDIGGKEAKEIIADCALSADHFTWHPVSRAVGNVKNQGPELIEAINFDNVRNVPRLCENPDLKLKCAHLRKIWNCSTG